MYISPFLGTWIGISSDDKTEFCIKKGFVGRFTIKNLR